MLRVLVPNLCGMMGLTILAGVLACGAKPHANPHASDGAQENRIIDGTESQENNYPSTGVLLFITKRFDGSKFGSMMCTATLIAPDVVLAAGHCNLELFVDTDVSVDYFFSRSLDVSDFGFQSLALPPRTVKVAKVVPHPNFDLYKIKMGLHRGNDIALFFLEKSIDDVAPAILIKKEEAALVQKDAEVEIVGYGRRHAEEIDEMDAGIKFHGKTRLNQIGKYEVQVSSGSPQPHKCHGDSGGPSFMMMEKGTKNAHLALIGITSHAYDRQDCVHGGVDTRVDPYLGWIERTLAAACKDRSRPACRQKRFAVGS